MDNEHLPFSEVLDRLFSAGRVPISLVYRLSDMSREELSAFQRRWSEQPPDRRRIIARHMADISEENFVVDFSPVFLRLMSDDSAEVRLAAVEGLWDTSNLAVVGPMIDLMQNDQEPEVRASAASCLGHFVLMAEWGQIEQSVGDRIVRALSDQYEQVDAAEEVRRASLESLGSAADPRVAGYIREAYDRGGETMQLSAVYAMGQTADRRWVPIIIQEMRSPYMEMRLEAARSAGNIGSGDAVDRLIELLHDEELEVQLAAV
ncbi:MAG TPA: HEAT repeat domain-containing protein, partial [Candidatus Binatia bacterium]|nr:HEAT repeat domain-containing protein [Candidatus Binatia bacterium]